LSVTQGGASHDQKTDVSISFVPPQLVLLPVVSSHSLMACFEVRAVERERGAYLETLEPDETLLDFRADYLKIVEGILLYNIGRGSDCEPTRDACMFCEAFSDESSSSCFL